jgi:WD40 repeat protein
MSPLRLVAFAACLVWLARSASPSAAQEPKAPDRQPAAVDLYGDPLPAGARARLGTVRFRLADFMNAAALSPDGKLLAVSNQMIALFDAATGKEVRRLGTTYIGALALAFAPDGKALASVNASNGRVQLWDPANGTSLAEFQGQGPQSRLVSVGFSGDGKTLAAGTEVFGQQQCVALVWDVAGRKEVARVEVLQNYRVMTALSGDGKTLATWGMWINRGVGGINNQEASQTIQLWNVATGKELRRVRIEHNTIQSAALSPDGKLLAAATGGSTVYLWDTATGKETRRFAGRRGLGSYLSFSRDGKVLAAAGQDGTVQLWDVVTGRRRGVCEAPTGRLSSLAFLTDGRIMAWGVEGQTVSLWEVPSGKTVTPQVAHSNRVTSLVFRGGKELLSTSLDGKVFTWDTATGKAVRETPVRDEDAARFGTFGGPGFFPGSRYQSLVLSPDGKYLAGGSSFNGMMRLWDMATGRGVCDFEGAQNSSLPVAFSPDGALVATAGFDRSVRVWEVDTGQQVRLVKYQRGDVRGIAFAPGGKAFAVARNDYDPNNGQQILEIEVLETATGKAVCSLKRTGVYLNAMNFSPDGKLLATAGQNSQTVTLWDAATGKEARTLDGQPGAVYSVAFAPDGRTLAAGTHDFGRFGGGGTGGVALYELATGQVRTRYRGHQGMVTALAYAPDARTLASGSADTSVLLWDLAGDAAPVAKGGLAEREVEALWADLAGTDAQRAYAAVLKFRAAPKEALTLFRKHLRPAKGGAATEAEITKLIEQMNDRRFPTRNKAQKALEELGTVVLLPLRKALKTPLASEEQRRRIETILGKLEKVNLSPDELRATRALEALEYIRTPEARELSAELARGAPGAQLTREAQGVTQRLDKAGP